MKISDLNFPKDYIFEKISCTIKDYENIEGGMQLKDLDGNIIYKGNNIFEFVSSKQIFEFTCEDKSNTKLISDYLKRKFYNIAVVDLHEKKSKTFFCSIYIFALKENIYSWDICIDEDMLKKTKSYGINNEIKLKNMISNFIFKNNNEECFTYSVGNYLSEEEEKNDNQIIGKDKAIRLYGKDYSLHLNIATKNDKEVMLVKRVEISPRNIPALRLASGKIKFTDESTFVSTMVKQLIQGNEETGYAKVWEAYAKQEGNMLLKHIRAIGLLKIDVKNSVLKNDQLEVTLLGNHRGDDIEDISKYLKTSGGELIFTNELPSYFENEELTWAEYYAAGKQQNLISHSIKYEVHGKDILYLDTQEIPSNLTFISLAASGNMTQIQRRELARQKITNGEAANPLLGLVIEGILPNDMTGKSKKIKPLSSIVKDKIFKNEPTAVQIKAINVALNTPDIAIIQGPPGTGKTTVITAVIERLNELSDKKQLKKGEVLITSFQHDAVKNVIERLTINSLPTIKYGSKRNDDLTSEQAISDWCQNLKERIEEKNPSLVTHTIKDDLHKTYRQYILSPNSTNAISFLNFAKTLITNEDLYIEIQKILDSLYKEEPENNETLMNYARKLRLTPKGFADDGPEKASDLLTYLEDYFEFILTSDDTINDILNTALSISGNNKNNVDKQLLKNLKEVQSKLFKICTPRITYKVEVPREDILDLYPLIVQEIKPKGDPKDEILYELLSNLQENYASVSETISEYSFVYAATTQQSVANDIAHAKGLKNSDGISYDTVIVDEAARVNPGDLMIPLSQAKNRIILVGDHRQLPHIYDEEIFESLQKNSDLGDNLSHVEMTMFQHLLEKAKQLTKQDKIPRFITLDNQYRMHPLLGEFVSRNFYDKYGESFGSPLGDEFFEQTLEEKPLVWLDLPHKLGETRLAGTSKMRTCEANCIVNKICDYLNCDEGKKLSIGVISFYSAQVKEVQRLLKKKQIEYPEIADLLKRVRVGSVDSFQGMEFDVMFLSVVRSHEKMPKFNSSDLNDDLKLEALGRRYYGFLTSENRLCVSLSRQKKLLIVVGNSDIFYKDSWGELAKNCLPAMNNLYDLCKTDGIIKRSEL